MGPLSEVPEAAPKATSKAPHQSNPAKYSIDYSRFSQIQDSDDEEDTVTGTASKGTAAKGTAAKGTVAKGTATKATAAVTKSTSPTAAEKHHKIADSKGLTRWSGNGLAIIEELKTLSRNTRAEMKRQLEGRGDQKPSNVDLPTDHKKHVGVLKAEELAKYGCTTKRILVSLYGDVFDVSDRPDLYSYGTYSWRSGRDITWSIIADKNDKDACNRFYNLFKLDEDHMQRFLQLLCQQLVSFEDNFGPPVGRLSEYLEDTSLPAAPIHEITSHQECKQQ